MESRAPGPVLSPADVACAAAAAAASATGPGATRCQYQCSREVAKTDQVKKPPTTIVRLRLDSCRRIGENYFRLAAIGPKTTIGPQAATPPPASKNSARGPLATGASPTPSRGAGAEEAEAGAGAGKKSRAGPVMRCDECKKANRKK
eukprot:1183146-Prorocentrum_minimum.AAC.2